MGVAYLSLGSNIAPGHNLRAALVALRGRFGAVALSPVYRTEAVGFAGDAFLNAAARIESDLDPHALDAWLHALEDAQGRRRDVPRFSSRPLDIDLLLYDDVVLRGAGNLELPRPELAEQAFVLRPMAELAPALVHPTLGRSLASLWDDFADKPAMTRVDLIAVTP